MNLKVIAQKTSWPLAGIHLIPNALFAQTLLNQNFAISIEERVRDLFTKLEIGIKICLLTGVKDYSFHDQRFLFIKKEDAMCSFDLSNTSIEYGVSKSKKTIIKTIEIILLFIPLTNTHTIAGKEFIGLYIHGIVIMDSSDTSPKGFDSVEIISGKLTETMMESSSTGIGFYDGSHWNMAAITG